MDGSGDQMPLQLERRVFPEYGSDLLRIDVLNVGDSGRRHKDGIQRTQSCPPLVHARLDVDVAQLVVACRHIEQHVLLDGPGPETVLVGLRRRGRGHGCERRRFALDIANVVIALGRGDKGGW